MNEDITFSMGLDTSKFGTGMRTAKRMMEEAKTSAGGLSETLKSLFAFTGLSLGIAAITAGAKSIIEFSEHIRDMAENTGVGTTLLQQFNYAARLTGSDSETAEKGLSKLVQKIGEARNGGEESAKVFAKWGISIKDASGQAAKTEAVIAQITEKLNQIADPALRAAMAFDLMGKSGAKLQLALKELDKYAAQSKGKIISEADLTVLDLAGKKIEGMGGHAKVLAGEFLSFISRATLFTSSLDIAKAAKDAKDASANGGGKTEEEKAASAKKLAEALKELLLARNAWQKETDDKYVALNRLLEQQKNIRQAIATGTHDEAEAAQLQADLEKNKTEILKAQKSIKEDQKKIDKETADKQREADLKKLAMQIEINDAAREEYNAKRDVSEAKENRSKLSIQELSSSNFRFGGTLGQDQAIARQITELERQGEWNRQHGFLDASQARFNSADALRQQLSSNVVEADRNPFRSLQETAKRQEQHLYELLEKAKKEGININPQLAK